MQHIAWVTDPHLNFVNIRQWESFVNQLTAFDVDAILLSGDVSESEDVIWQLRRIVAAVEKPVYFVLGNHDFYHGSIVNVRRAVEAVCGEESMLRYMTGSLPEELCGGWTLCGDDGWADGRIGDYFRSPVRMNDFRLIQELAGLDSSTRLRVLKREGVASAVRLRRQMEIARKSSRRTIVLTHVPPFREACWYDGQHSNDDWAPFFCCHAVGWMLRRFCARFPDHEVLVLCGHTHSRGKSQIAKNLVVWTGAAEYGTAEVSEHFNLAEFSYPDNDWTYFQN